MATALSFREIGFLLTLIVLLAPLTACGVGDAEATAEMAPPKAIPVTTENPIRGEAFAYYDGTANLETDSEASVVAKVGGEIVEMLVEEGQQVTAGQIVARLDQERFRLVAEQARADLNRLTQEYRRNVQLHERGLVSEGAFENLRYDLEALDAAHKLAQLDLDYTNVRAPIDGVVAEKLGRIGNTVTAGDVVMRISNSNTLLADVHVPQRDISSFSVGQSAQLSLDALPQESQRAEVIRISPRIDSETGTVKVTLGVANTDGRLRPGMFARVRIVYAVRPNALLVSQEAILAEDAEPAVYVVEDGVARRREVTTGMENGNKVEVTSGLQGTEQIITVGQAAVRDGTPVTVQNSGQQI